MRTTYGPDPSQFGDLSVPAGSGPWPVVVVIHGGFWRARYDLTLGQPLAADLVRRGFAAWNIEYRRVGNGGGWPATLLDVAAAVDRLADLAGAAGPDGEALDLRRVIALGHSAGGHLAAWLAARPRLPAPFGPAAVRVTGVVSQAGVLDLEAARADRLGDGAIDAFMAGAAKPDWASASPIRLLPVGVPVVCVHGDADDTVPVAQSERFVAAARAAGDPARSMIIPGGDHFGVITPGDPGWAACAQAVEELAGGS
ncbi:alpha/beta hydrolase family protein [Microlunatus ginsengisoli]|uniref:Alpha/beta hydrolase n=1 Tax=Microlunatus ginsengisoli TaxID=363863 RepID=A0ABP6ZUS2_9ACTN